MRPHSIESAQDPSRHARCYTVVRNVPRNHGTRANHAVLTNHDIWQNAYTEPQEGILSDDDGAPPRRYTIANLPPFPGCLVRMSYIHDGAVTSNRNVLADPYRIVADDVHVLLYVHVVPYLEPRLPRLPVAHDLDPGTVADQDLPANPYKPGVRQQPGRKNHRTGSDVAEPPGIEQSGYGATPQ